MINTKPIAVAVYKYRGVTLKVMQESDLDKMYKVGVKGHFIGVWRVKYKTQECNFS